MSEPLQSWVFARLDRTKAFALRPRPVDLPAAAVHTIEINLRTGECKRSTERLKAPPKIEPPPPVFKPPPPLATRCERCGALVRPPKRKFCSLVCSKRFHGGYAPLIEENPQPLPLPLAIGASIGTEQAVRRIQAIVAGVFEIPVADLVSPVRRYRLSRPRQAAMWVVYKLLGSKMSLPQIGRAFRRDHTTIMHALRRHGERAGDRRWHDWICRCDDAEERCRVALGLGESDVQRPMARAAAD